jgi:hypothetical protein
MIESLGSFSGTIIPDGSDIATAFLSLEQAVEQKPSNDTPNSWTQPQAFTVISTTSRIRAHGTGPNSQTAWPSTNSPSNNIFSYLDNAGIVSSGVPTTIGPNIAISGFARTSDTFGTLHEVAIGLSGFVYNDKQFEGTPGVNGDGGPNAARAGAWAGYLTAYRAAGAYGATHALEIDIANAGNTVPIFPADINGGVTGLTNGIQLAVGGEATATPGLVKTASSALSILSNDPNYAANFEKGIVFHRHAIFGTDGDAGRGMAIAFSTGHEMAWYNTSNQIVGSIFTEPSSTPSSCIQMVFNAGGLIFSKASDGGVLFRVEPVASATSYISAIASAAGGSPHLAVKGSSTNIDFFIEPKGEGVLGVTYAIELATTPGSFQATHLLGIKDGTDTLFYVPATVAKW